MKTHRQISAKGGKSGRGAARRRTREQCRAAAKARWAKRQPKSEKPNPELSRAECSLTR